MFFKEMLQDIDLEREIIDSYDLENVAFFDIESTGFNKTQDIIMLISLGYFTEGKFIVKQYFAEYREDEVAVLEGFKRDIEPFDKWCSYNGIAFDEPYIIKRMDKHGIEFTPPKEHIDLYRKIKPYQGQLGIERCNLKSVEKYLGIEREDKIDGGITVQLYKQFLYTNNESIRDTIMLHNFEDALYLPLLFRAIKDIDDNPNVKVEKISKNQMNYLRSLLRKNKMTIKSNIEGLTRNEAARAIEALIKGNTDGDKIDKIIEDTF